MRRRGRKRRERRPDERTDMLCGSKWFTMVLAVEWLRWRNQKVGMYIFLRRMGWVQAWYCGDAGGSGVIVVVVEEEEEEEKDEGREGLMRWFARFAVLVGIVSRADRRWECG